MQVLSLHQQRERLADAVEQVWSNAWASLGAFATTNVENTPEFVRVVTPTSSEMLLNAVLRYRHAQRVTPHDIESVLAPYRKASRPLQWWVRLDNEPIGLRQQLRQVGMQPWSELTGMALPLENWQPQQSHADNHIEIRPVANATEAESALQLICDVFLIPIAPMRYWGAENPNFTLFTASVEGIPVGALACQTRGGVAGFFHVATHPDWRQRGIASSLMQQALLVMQQQGATTAALTASPMAESMYRHLGFQDACRYEFWMPNTRFLMGLH